MNRILDWLRRSLTNGREFADGRSLRFAFGVIAVGLFCSLAPPRVSWAQDADGPPTEAAEPETPNPVASQPAASQPTASAPSEDRRPLCPVSGNPINRKVYVYFKGKRVYFDSPQSRAKFETDSMEYADGVKAQWERMRPLWIQVRCPVTKEPLRTLDWFVEGPQSRIYFATPEAMAEWLKDTANFRGKFPNCMSYQSQCAVCENESNPTIEARIKGKPYYFCCEGCRDVFLRKPGDFIPAAVEKTKENKAAWFAQNNVPLPPRPRRR